jgi:hypothetical protein
VKIVLLTIVFKLPSLAVQWSTVLMFGATGTVRCAPPFQRPSLAGTGPEIDAFGTSRIPAKWLHLKRFGLGLTGSDLNPGGGPPPPKPPANAEGVAGGSPIPGG